MKKFRNLFSEQHREKARFHPTVPYNVPETKPAAGTLTKKKECTCEEAEPLDEMPGANMDTRAVHSHLKKQGWKLTRTSGSHDVFTHPNSSEHIPVPRHRKLKAPLVLGILRKSKVNEETEMKKLDEISMETHKSYQKAARREVPALASHAQSGEYKEFAQKLLDKRIGGMERSTRLQMRKRMTKEEVEHDADSLDRHFGHGTAMHAAMTRPAMMVRKDKEGKKHSIVQTGKGKWKSSPMNEETEIDEAKLAMPLKGHAYHYKSDAELKYIQKDAHEAAQAMKGHNPKAEGKYLDQHNDASTVLHYRSKGGQQLRKEEIEQIDEISKQTLGSYVQKASADVVNRAKEHGKNTEHAKYSSKKTNFYRDVAAPRVERRIEKRVTGLQTAARKLAKEEYEMNEETHPLGAHAAALEKYAHERGGIDKEDMLTAAEHMKSNNHEALKNKIRKMDTDPRDKVLDHIHPHHWEKLGFKPTGSMATAVHHHNKMHGIKEETEQLDEISKETKKSYIGKAVDDMTKRTMRIASTSPRAAVQPEVSQRLVKAGQKNVQRKAGIMRAVSSLAKEEVEHNENEILLEFYDEESCRKNGGTWRPCPPGARCKGTCHKWEPIRGRPRPTPTTGGPRPTPTIGGPRPKPVREETDLTEENKPTNPELWARAKAMAKSKFDVYPSAYANGWAAKWYKSKGGGWKSVDESVEQIDENYPFVAVHAKKGKHETHGKTSYEAAQKAAKHWGMKNTAGIDVYRADKTHSTQHVGEEVEHLDELSKSTLSSYASKATDSARTMPGYGTKDEGSKKTKRMTGIVSAVKKLAKEEIEPPFEPTKPKKDVVVGKKGEGYAKARQLARQAMKKQTEKLSKVTMKQESLEESRKTEVVRELAKKKKDEKFEADPVLSDTVVKSAMPQP